MTTLDHEIDALAEALLFRLGNRGDAPGQYPADDAVFAQEFMTVLLGRGWRPTEARRVDVKDLPRGDGTPPEDVRQELDELRARLAAREG
jgi:hypothetical protein